MNLIEKYNMSTSEDKMQQAVAKYMEDKTFDHVLNRWETNKIKAKVYREIRIPEVSRISDIIVYLSDRKIFNIECKINAVDHVIEQAIDHLRWCDYSYVCLHARTYVSGDHIRKMITNGIGMLLYRPYRKEYTDYTNGIVPEEPEFIVDCFGAYKSSHNKTYRQAVIRKLKLIDAEKINHGQLSINEQPSTNGS